MLLPSPRTYTHYRQVEKLISLHRLRISDIVHIEYGLKFKVHYYCLAFKEIGLSSIFLGDISIPNFIVVLLLGIRAKFSIPDAPGKTSVRCAKGKENISVKGC